MYRISSLHARPTSDCAPRRAPRDVNALADRAPLRTGVRHKSTASARATRECCIATNQTNLRSRNLQTRSPGERPQIRARGAPGFSGRLFQTSPACFVNIEYRTVSCTDVQGTHVFRGVFRVCSGAPQPRPRRTYGERTSLSRAQTHQSAHGTHAARLPYQPIRTGTKNRAAPARSTVQGSSSSSSPCERRESSTASGDGSSLNARSSAQSRCVATSGGSPASASAVGTGTGSVGVAKPAATMAVAAGRIASAASLAGFLRFALFRSLFASSNLSKARILDFRLTSRHAVTHDGRVPRARDQGVSGGQDEPAHRLAQGEPPAREPPAVPADAAAEHRKADGPPPLQVGDTGGTQRLPRGAEIRHVDVWSALAVVHHVWVREGSLKPVIVRGNPGGGSWTSGLFGCLLWVPRGLPAHGVAWGGAPASIKKRGISSRQKTAGYRAFHPLAPRSRRNQALPIYTL